MVTLNPYLNFNGKTEEAFNFYKSIFGGEFTMLQRMKDTPEADKLSPEDREKVMHVGLPIGKGNVLMGTDSIESMGHVLTEGNNFSLSLQVENKEEADRLFTGLSKGGTVEMPMQDMFWGAYYGMLKDAYGIQWMINCDHAKS
jgi:PhnB protein